MLNVFTLAQGRLVQQEIDSPDTLASAQLLTRSDPARADEMLARPFSSQAVLVRLKSVLDRPRRFVDCASYIGPCRRRRSRS